MQSIPEPGVGPASAPIIFVTGIGQTWSTLQDDNEHRWNLFPGDREVLFKDFPRGARRKLVRFAARAALTVTTGLPAVRKKDIDPVFKALLRWCTADADGRLPAEVNVRIYGARSFDVLGKTDFRTGAYTDDYDKSLLARIYTDIPCQELAVTYGAHNLYCFNYSTFSDIYADADALRGMIEAVLADQVHKTGAKKVILIPMSMGATIVSAYLDRYYTDTGSVGDSLVDKVVSIVGAWDGSDGLADLIACNGGADWNERFYNGLLREKLQGKKACLLRLINKKATNRLLRQLVDGLLDNLLLNTSSFLALIPLARYDELEKKLFSPARMQTLPRIAHVKTEADAYHAAQMNLRRRLYAIRDNCGVGFYFICGYNMPFGTGGSDFDFLHIFDSGDKTNSDTVIQVSSTAPGTSWARVGDRLPETDESNPYRSPDGTIDASTAWFPDTCWYFEGQEHELGHNNTALRLAIDIALGKVGDIHNGAYPQFNESRDIRGVRRLLEEARALAAALEGGTNKQAPEAAAEAAHTHDEAIPEPGTDKHTPAPVADRQVLEAAIKDVEDMLKRTVNRRRADDALLAALRQAVELTGRQRRGFADQCVMRNDNE